MNQFYKHIQAHCSPPNAVLFIGAQQALNVSLVSNAIHVPEDELHDLEWLTQIRYGEMMIQRIPNHIITTRDHFLILRNFRVKVLSCVTAKSISQHFDYVIVTTLDGYTWLALLTVSLVYGVLYGNIFRGLDVMWHLTSQACWLKHPRKSVCLLWVSLIFVGSFYSSSISSESMQLADLPSFSRLFKTGYKLWVPTKQSIFRFAGSYEKEFIVNSVSIALGSGSTGERNYLTIDDVKNFTYDGNRVGASYIINKFSEAGIPTKFENLQIDVRQNAMRELKMMTVGAFLSPKPIELQSALGHSAYIMAAPVSEEARILAKIVGWSHTVVHSVGLLLAAGLLLTTLWTGYNLLEKESVVKTSEDDDYFNQLAADDSIGVVLFGVSGTFTAVSLAISGPQSYGAYLLLQATNVVT
ncbi:unnamed protein product [Orchesella dallaii]|uniref:Ionotropic glutamate receptor C-terminal domain-containing protein n=1 Tax=Orchesella dallaii TaxID=48710 RepID=A0ABP1RV00_9HEXA